MALAPERCGAQSGRHVLHTDDNGGRRLGGRLEDFATQRQHVEAARHVLGHCGEEGRPHLVVDGIPIVVVHAVEALTRTRRDCREPGDPHGRRVASRQEREVDAEEGRGVASDGREHGRAHISLCQVERQLVVIGREGWWHGESALVRLGGVGAVAGIVDWRRSDGDL